MAETTISEKLKAVSDNVPKVYEAGRDVGKNEEWSSFWDSYQQNGDRRDYSYVFCGGAWTEENFRPKYDIIVNDGSYVFFRSKLTIDLGEFLKKLGVNVEIAIKENCSLYYGFHNSGFTALPVIDLSESTSYTYAPFTYCFNLKKIEKIILGGSGVQDMNQWFDYDEELEEIRFEGKIKWDIDVHWSTKLSANSILSIFEALSDDVTGTTLTFPSTAEETFETYFADDPDISWSLMVSRYPNWTIVLQ